MKSNWKNVCLAILVWILSGGLLSGCLNIQAPVSPSNTDPSMQVAPTKALGILPSVPPKGDQTLTGEQSQALLTEYHTDLDALQDLVHYQIELTVNFDDLTFEGVAQIDFVNNEQTPLDRVYFRLFPNGQKSYGDGSLAVSAVFENGQPAETKLSQTDTVLEVTLQDELSPGIRTTFEILFQGRVPHNFGGDATGSGYGIYNFSDNVLALSGWYPILAVYDEDGWNLDPNSEIGDSVYSEIALYTVELTVDPTLVVAATGVEVGRREEQDATRYRLVSGPVRDFFLVLSPSFQVVSQDVDGTLVKSLYLPGHEDRGVAGLEIASDSLAVFNVLFGSYPYTELEVVEAPMRYALGVEYPGIFLVTSESYSDPEDTGFAATIAHETAHQWWYNLVGNDVIDDPWLDEALTTYSASLYYQAKFGQGGYQGYVDYLQNRYDEFLDEGKDEVVTLSLPTFEAFGEPRIYSRVVYTKGALFFKSLREEIGDKAFFKALQNYFENQKYRLAKPEDLLMEFEAASGQNLDELYQQWLYSKVIPQP